MPVSISDFIQMPDQLKDLAFIVALSFGLGIIDLMGGVEFLIGHFNQLVGAHIYAPRGVIFAGIISIYGLGFLNYMGGFSK